MTRAYFRNAVGAILVYDVTKRQSFENIKNTWIPQLQEFGHENMYMIIIGNKSDLDPSQHIVRQAEAAEFAGELYPFCYFKLSKRGTFSTGVNLTNIAERYYLELYEDDFPETCANLGMFYLLRQNTVEGIKYLTEGIEKKCGRSFNSLATHYINYNLQDKQDEIEQLFQIA